jgi:hypothetical protein
VGLDPFHGALAVDLFQPQIGVFRFGGSGGGVASWAAAVLGMIMGVAANRAARATEVRNMRRVLAENKAGAI